MLFRKNQKDEQHVWVDRGIDDHVDNFNVCAPCNDALLTGDPHGERWHEGAELCASCRAGFQAHAMMVDLFGLPRPFNGMLEDRLLINDEWEADVRHPDPLAFDYFVPE